MESERGEAMGCGVLRGFRGNNTTSNSLDTKKCDTLRKPEHQEGKNSLAGSGSIVFSLKVLYCVCIQSFKQCQTLQIPQKAELISGSKQAIFTQSRHCRPCY